MARGLAQFRDAGNRVGNRASLVFLVAGTIFIALHGFGLLGPLEGSTFHVLSVATFLATLLGIYWYRPAARWPWIAIAAGLMLFVIGGIRGRGSGRSATSPRPGRSSPTSSPFLDMSCSRSGSRVSPGFAGVGRRGISTPSSTV